MGVKFVGSINNIVINRTMTPDERQAYKNLKDYDGGEYKVKSIERITEVLSKDNKYQIMQNSVLETNQDEIDDFLNYAQLVNFRHADFRPGLYVDKSAYESSYAKKVYFSSELEFIIELFISHHNIHGFADGNKRTALNVLIDLTNKLTKYYLKDILLIQDAQILYLEKRLTKQEFLKLIYNEVKVKLFISTMKCNLEHLIPRRNIEASDNNQIALQSDRRSGFNLTDLEKGQFFYDQLRKPVFQRDTNQWTVERLEKLIITFLDDGLIPAIILWESSDGEIYVIDGSHRISSLIAWVNSDYGKENQLSDSNHNAIEEYINDKIGSYNEIKASKNEKYKQVKQIIAKRSIAVQWVTGNYEKVKESFIRINEQGVVISEDEKELIENDSLDTSKLSRAILSHGLGQTSRDQSEKSLELFNRLFIPYFSFHLKNFPLAGSLNEDFVISRIYNFVKIVDSGEKLGIKDLEEKALNLLCFVQDELNINQQVYFYGATQKFKTNSFYGFMRFMSLLIENQDLLSQFVNNRREFEDYLVENERHIQEIARKKRQAKKAYDEVADYYKAVLEACSNEEFKNIQLRFPYLDFRENKHVSTKGKNILRKYEDNISKIPRCVRCGGFIDGREGETKSHSICTK
ncbi:hypothetical protein GCM10008013_19500 [Paenibacillus segetis]|uniref:GmrSD restriction endonucleases N-terminal domain-containing protein n=2 Tax=Paenibacillus segetis TaxID=1325360 RepID=A0ABQ1YEK7_9BACL|nr:hypothetical protein GCM10008013_19500 [Paenibacillus segetis]